MSLNKKIANLLPYRKAPHGITNETQTVTDKTMNHTVKERGATRDFKEKDHVIVRGFKNDGKSKDEQIES